MKKLFFSALLAAMSLGANGQLAVDFAMMTWFGNADGTNLRPIDDICECGTVYLYNFSRYTPNEIQLGNVLDDSESGGGDYNVALEYGTTANPGNPVVIATIPAENWPADGTVDGNNYPLTAGTAWAVNIPCNANLGPIGSPNLQIGHNGVNVVPIQPPGGGNGNGSLIYEIELRSHAAWADAGLDQITCSNEPVTLNGSGASNSTYSWSPGNLSGQNPVVNPSSTTNYTLTVNTTFAGANPGGDWDQVFVTCSTTDQVTVNVNAAPNIYSQSFPLCSNDPMPILDGTQPAVSWQWTYQPDLNTSPTVISFNQTINTALWGYGIYKVKTTNAAGCTRVAQFDVFLHQSAQLDADYTLQTTSSNGLTFLSMFDTDPNADFHYWNIAHSNANGDHLGNIFTIWGNLPSYSYPNLSSSGYYLVTHGVRANPCDEWLYQAYLALPADPRKPGRREFIPVNLTGTSVEDLNNQVSTLEMGKEYNTMDELTVYPNPASEEFTLEIPAFNDAANYEVSIMSMDGKVVFNDLLNNRQSKIDLSGFDSGMYLIVVSDGVQKRTKKITVQ